MLNASSSTISEDLIIDLYQKATSGEDPDSIEMVLIEGHLRKNSITLKRKAGASSVNDGVGTMEDVKAASIAISLFGVKQPKLSLGAGSSDGVDANMDKWKRAGLLAGKTRGLIRELFENESDIPGMEFAGEDEGT